MKTIPTKKYFQKIIALTLLFITCVNWGQSQNSNIDGSGDEPEVSFYGKIIDTSGNEYEAKDFLISRKYKKIQVYAIPPSTDIDPNSNVTYLDLVELIHQQTPDTKVSIEVKEPGKIQTYKGRDYIAVTFTAKNGTPTTYLIETNRTVTCGKIQGQSVEEKELHFQAIKSIIITSYEKKKEKDAELVTKKT